MPWADRGIGENQYAVMSDAELLSFESISAAPKIQASRLMIHGEDGFLPGAAPRHIEAIPSTTKHEVFWEDTPHLAYYDQPDVLDSTASRVAEWFSGKVWNLRWLPPVCWRQPKAGCRLLQKTVTANENFVGFAACEQLNQI